jgi:hypothetical protein
VTEHGNALAHEAFVVLRQGRSAGHGDHKFVTVALYFLLRNSISARITV